MNIGIILSVDEKRFVSGTTGFVEEFVRGLRDAKKVKVRGIGTFTLKTMKERQGVNPVTGERITISARQKVAFKASKALLDEIG